MLGVLSLYEKVDKSIYTIHYNFIMARTRLVTRTHTSTIFSAAESAPSALEAVQPEALITNDYGNVALRGFTVDGETARLDTTTEPPQLHLSKAMTTALFGYTDPEGVFVQYNNEMSARSTTVTGIYAGPNQRPIAPNRKQLLVLVTAEIKWLRLRFT